MFAALLRAKQCPMLSARGCLASWQLIRVGCQLLTLGEHLRGGGVHVPLLGLNLMRPV